MNRILVMLHSQVRIALLFAGIGTTARNRIVLRILVGSYGDCFHISGICATVQAIS